MSLNIRYLPLVFLACVAGCTAEHIKITSSPPGASVFICGKVVGETPLTVDFFSNRPYLVRAELSGYAPAEFNSIPIKKEESTGKKIASGVAVTVLLAAGMGGGITTNPTNVYHHDPIAFVLQPLVNTNRNDGSSWAWR